jgi:aspartate racemase
LRKVGLFDRVLDQAGLVPAYPADQDALLSAIREIKAKGPTDQTRAALVRASSDLMDQGARVQIIACTEFSLIADATAPGAQAFDTLDVLTTAICAFATAPDPAA